jgi:hypothetical protein
MNGIVLAIIENDKGLLISFKILSTQVGYEPAIPSLMVTMGDIKPMSTTVVR